MSQLSALPSPLNLTPLQQQAIRLMRTNWNDQPLNVLAQELYMILFYGGEATTGPVSVSPGPGTGTPAAIGPFPDLNLPALDLPAFLINPGTTNPQGQGFGNQTPDQTPDSPQQGSVVQEQTQWFRTATPGRVVSSNGDGTYQMNVFPYGTTGQTTAVKVQQLDKDSSHQKDDWGLVIWIWKLSVKTIPNQQTQVKVVQQNYYTQMGGNGGGGVPGQIQALLMDTGDGTQTYTVKIYPNGLKDSNGKAQDPKTVQAIQLQIAQGAELPNGTWVLVSKAGSNYYMQFPVAA